MFLMRKTLKEIAELIGGEVLGDGNVVITGVCGIREASEGDITFLANPKYLPLLESTRASAVITSPDVSSASKPLLRTQNPSLAFATMVSLVAPEDIKHPKGIHPASVIAASATIGRNAAIGACVVIEENAFIGDDTIIYPGCFIGHDARIGAKTLVYPNVSIRERVSIGNRVIIHSGTVIGSDGFGFATIDGVHHKIPQVGTVVVEDDVEIGANVTIDRARFDKTVVGAGTKIDNLVQIAHNVIIGKHCLIVAQAGISGSTVLGDGVILAGQVGLVGHIKIGDGAIIMAQSGVSKDVPAQAMMMGYPAKPHEVYRRVNACVQNLPKLFDTVAALKKKIEALEHQKEAQNG
jgi:UDP-3-O-[3-hydroxymyristoyl] glucosamine N-acyltransferase